MILLQALHITLLAVNHLTLTGVNGLLHQEIIPHVVFKTPLSFDPCGISLGKYMQ